MSERFRVRRQSDFIDLTPKPAPKPKRARFVQINEDPLTLGSSPPRTGDVAFFVEPVVLLDGVALEGVQEVVVNIEGQLVEGTDFTARWRNFNLSVPTATVTIKRILDTDVRAIQRDRETIKEQVALLTMPFERMEMKDAVLTEVRTDQRGIVSLLYQTLRYAGVLCEPAS